MPRWPAGNFGRQLRSTRDWGGASWRLWQAARVICAHEPANCGMTRRAHVGKDRAGLLNRRSRRRLPSAPRRRPSRAWTSPLAALSSTTRGERRRPLHHQKRTRRRRLAHREARRLARVHLCVSKSLLNGLGAVLLLELGEPLVREILRELRRRGVSAHEPCQKLRPHPLVRVRLVDEEGHEESRCDAAEEEGEATGHAVTGSSSSARGLMGRGGVRGVAAPASENGAVDLLADGRGGLDNIGHEEVRNAQVDGGTLPRGGGARPRHEGHRARTESCDDEAEHLQRVGTTTPGSSLRGTLVSTRVFGRQRSRSRLLAK